MRKTPQLVVSEILKTMASMATPGARLIDIDLKAKLMMDSFGVTSADYNYRPKWAKSPYPAYTCIGVDNVICHGVPSDHCLQNGEIVSLDVGVETSKGCGDAALTVAVGEVDPKRSLLLQATKEALYAGISVVKAGVSTAEIGKAVEAVAKKYGLTVNRNYGGHGIGQSMHQAPRIYNFYDSRLKYETLQAGQIICIEPMLTTGKDYEGIICPDQWTVITRDNEPSAIFEHMIEVKEGGHNILTTHI